MGKISKQKHFFTEQYIRRAAYEAVLRVLAEHGLAKLTISRVACVADLGTGTLYNYFRDKDALLVYVALELFQQVRQKQARAVEQAAAHREKLRSFVTTTFRYFNENRNFFRFLDQADIYCKMDMEVKFDHIDAEKNTLAEIIKAGIEEGVFKNTDVERTAAFFQRAMYGTLRIDTEIGDFVPDKEADIIVETFETFLLCQNAT